MKVFQFTEFGGPEVMHQAEAPKPKISANEILVKVKAVGINPVETYIRGGAFDYVEVKFPHVLGSDFAGTVEEASPEVASQYPPGTNVWGFLVTRTGAYAEYVTAKVATSSNDSGEQIDIVQKLPSNCSFATGAAIGIPYLTVYRAFFTMHNLQAGQTVLVHGASGGVGLAACSIAAAHGCTVYATVGTKVGEANVKASGAKYVFYHSEKNYTKELEKHVAGGFDVILENAWHFNIEKDMTLIKKNGKILVIGARANESSGIENFMKNVLYKEINISGIIIFNGSNEELTGHAADITAKLASSQYSPITVNFPFSECSKAQKEVMEPSKGGAQGKVVLVLE